MYHATTVIMMIAVFLFVKTMLSARTTEAELLEVKGQRARICFMHMDGLNALTLDKKVDELRERMQYKYLDVSVLQFCLGTSIPVDTKAADLCWIAKSDGECYREVLNNLAQAYKDKQGSWQ